MSFDDKFAVMLPEDYKQGTLEEYHVRRIINGIPEGIDDFIAGTSLPLEYNLDYMNGGMTSFSDHGEDIGIVAGCSYSYPLLLSTYL